MCSDSHDHKTSLLYSLGLAYLFSLTCAPIQPPLNDHAPLSQRSSTELPPSPGRALTALTHPSFFLHPTFTSLKEFPGSHDFSSIRCQILGRSCTSFLPACVSGFWPVKWTSGSLLNPPCSVEQWINVFQELGACQMKDAASTLLPPAIPPLHPWTKSCPSLSVSQAGEPLITKARYLRSVNLGRPQFSNLIHSALQHLVLLTTYFLSKIIKVMRAHCLKKKKNKEKENPRLWSWI